MVAKLRVPTTMSPCVKPSKSGPIWKSLMIALEIVTAKMDYTPMTKFVFIFFDLSDRSDS